MVSLFRRTNQSSLPLFASILEGVVVKLASGAWPKYSNGVKESC